MKDHVISIRYDYGSYLTIKFRCASLRAVTVSYLISIADVAPSTLFSGNRIEVSDYQPFPRHVPGEKPSLQAIKPAIFTLHFHDTKTLTDL